MAINLVPIAISSQLDVTGEEKIHAANYTPLVRPSWSAPLFNIYSNILGDTTILFSNDGGDTFTETVDAGGSVGILPIVAAAGDRLFRLRNSNGMVSTDGTNFVACTGISLSGICGALYTGAEYLLYGNSNNLSVSAGGQAFSSRSIGANCISLAKSGDTIVGITGSSNGLVRSVDNGANFSTANTGLSSTLARIIHNGTRFIVAGEGTNKIQYSDTGLDGSWVAATSPTSNGIRRLACNPTTGRVVIVDSAGASYYSDDDGATWTAGGTVPHTIPSNSQDNYMIFTNGNFFLNPNPVDNSSYIYSSPDSLSWTLVFNSQEAYNLGNLAAFMV